MDFFDVVNARHSMRKYSSIPVEESKLQQILETANKAPSAGNLQGYEIYVIRKPELRKQLSAASWDQESLLEAPLVLVFCAHPARSEEQYGERGVDLYAVQDATIACAYSTLAVTALGLCCVWVGAFEPDAVRKTLGAPDGQTPVVMLPIGYPGKETQVRPRRALKDLVHEVK